MKTYFGLGWIPDGKNWAKHFKSSGTLNLFQDYLARIEHFSPSGAGKIPDPETLMGKKIWVCDTAPSAKQLSSEALAVKLSQIQDSGVKDWVILIGGPDGFPAKDLTSFKPDFRWNFGAMTLPHELAAVVAAEQIYRAWTILHHLPYHTKH